MNINYICPHWGSEKATAGEFIERVQSNGYEGIEINLPRQADFCRDFMQKVDKIRQEEPRFTLILQHILSPQTANISDFIAEIKRYWLYLAAFEPTFINSHTGKDYFTFDQNSRILEAYEQLSQQTGIPVYHEIHRGRFSFHAPSLVPYLQRFPSLSLVGDFSHFCVVSESLLEGQEVFIEQIIPHIKHIHARVGSQQASQVSDPAAPEWQPHLHRFLDWWKQMVAYHRQRGTDTLSITPEFGPSPYMPALPFTQQPIGNQWEINLFMKDFLRKNLGENTAQAD